MQKSIWGGIVIWLALYLSLSGCAGGGRRIVVASPSDNLTVSLSLPAGWVTEGSVDEGMADFVDQADPESRGTVFIWRAEGKDLAAWVEDYLENAAKLQQGAEMLGEAGEQALGYQLISRNEKQVGDYDAVELVEEIGGKRSIMLLVKKADRICQVSFNCKPQDWDKNEPLFRAGLAAVEVR